MSDSDGSAHGAPKGSRLDEAEGNAQESAQGQHEPQPEPTDGAPPPEPPIDAVEDPPRKPPTGEGAGPQDPDPHGKRVADWTRRLTIVTGVLVFVGVCQLGAAVLQWNAMNGQLQEMRGSAPDTKRLVTANENLAAGMREQAENTHALVGEAANSASAAQQSAGLSGQQLTEMRHEDAPIIGESDAWYPTGARYGPACFPGGVFGWSYGLENYGKSPAFNVRSTEYMSIGGAHFRGLVREVGELIPGTGVWSTVMDVDKSGNSDKNGCAIATPQVIKPNPGVIVEVYINYQDAFGNKLHETICRYIMPNGIDGICDGSPIKAIPSDPPIDRSH